MIGTLGRWHSSGNFQGIRLTAEAITEHESLLSTAANLGMIIVLLRAAGIAPILPRLEKELQSAPFTRLVITHLGNPSFENDDIAASARDMFRLARFGNVYLQALRDENVLPLSARGALPADCRRVHPFRPQATCSGARTTRSSAQRTTTWPTCTSYSTANIRSRPTPSPKSPAKTRSGCGSTGGCETRNWQASGESRFLPGWLSGFNPARVVKSSAELPHQRNVGSESIFARASAINACLRGIAVDWPAP